jgi:hypothetical protein
MFSTYCPTCDSEVLLGTRCIVHFTGQGGPDAVILRCTCGTLVSGDARRPEPASTPEPADDAVAALPTFAEAS